MPNQKPFVLDPDEVGRAGETTTAQELDVFTRPDEMVELLLATQPHHSDQEVGLTESFIEEELAWISEFRNS